MRGATIQQQNSAALAAKRSGGYRHLGAKILTMKKGEGSALAKKSPPSTLSSKPESKR